MKQLFLISILLSGLVAKSQFVRDKKAVPDSSYTIPMFAASYAYQWSGADMATRFGSNSNVGGSFTFKTKTNWYYGIKGNLLFGGKVNEPNLLNGILTSELIPNVIDDNGQLTDITFGQRGSSFFAIGGRLINKLAPNRNSGILVYGGFGILQHKISIKFQDNIASLTDEHKKGYDRFSLGYAANGFIGYLFLSKNRLINFFAGFDYTIGWTKSLRKYNYDTQEIDTERHTNTLSGIRFGWIIRMNKRQTDEFYYQ